MMSVQAGSLMQPSESTMAAESIRVSEEPVAGPPLLRGNGGNEEEKYDQYPRTGESTDLPHPREEAMTRANKNEG